MNSPDPRFYHSAHKIKTNGISDESTWFNNLSDLLVLSKKLFSVFHENSFWGLLLNMAFGHVPVNSWFGSLISSFICVWFTIIWWSRGRNDWWIWNDCWIVSCHHSGFIPHKSNTLLHNTKLDKAGNMTAAFGDIEVPTVSSFYPFLFNMCEHACCLAHVVATDCHELIHAFVYHQAQETYFTSAFD